MNPLRADQLGPLDMFKIGVGPSSSHTVGPMLAALEFRKSVEQQLSGKAPATELFCEVELYGSLSATGKGARNRWCHLRRTFRFASTHCAT